MITIVRHLPDEANYAKVGDLLDFRKKYFENRQSEGIIYLIEDFGIDIVIKEYIQGFLFPATFLKPTGQRNFGTMEMNYFV